MNEKIHKITPLNTYAVLLMIISLFRNLTNKDFQGGWLFMLILTFFIFLILIALDFLIQQIKISKKRKIIVQVMLIILFSSFIYSFFNLEKIL
jgi:hypothetical protein